MAVGSDGKLAVGDEAVDPADLVQLVKLKLGDDSGRVVHLRGDKEVPYGQMVAVLDQLATNGITHIAIVTEGGKKAGAPAPSLAPAPAPVQEPGK